MADTDVGAIVLAAGESRRFGGRKQLALLDGRTLLEHVVLTAHRALLSPIVAVVPIWLTRPRSWNADDLLWIRNPFPERGLSHSLRLALAALPTSVGAAVILLGDQPTVTERSVAALLAARGERPIVAGQVDGVLAPPLLIERSLFGVVQELSGDIGLREVLISQPDWVTRVPVEVHAPDVDTPDDLERLRTDR